MKKTIFMLFPMFLLFLSSILLSQENKLQVTAARAYIYTDPSIDSSIIETVERGTILNQISPGEIRYIWYRVSYYSKKKSTVVVGFIQTSSVKILQEVPKIAREVRQKPRIIQEKQIFNPITPQRAYAPKKFKLGPKSGVGFLAGYAMPAENNYSSGLKYGGNIYLALTNNVSLELKGLSFQSAVEGDPEALSKGKLSIMPIQLSIQAKFRISSRLFPYILGGGGYYLNKFDLDEEIIAAWDALGFDLEEKVENAVGYHVGAGIDLFITKNIALNADVRYFITQIKGSWTLTDQIMGIETSGDIENLNLNSLIFGGGLKFYF